MPLLLPDNVNAATRLISISMRSASDSTDSTISAAIPAIAGGTAAGVVLAVVAVMGWKWWAFIIRRTNKPQCSSSRQNVLRKPSRATPTKSNEALRSTTNINCNSAESPNCKKDFKEPPTNTTSPHSTTNHDPMITTTPAPSGPPIKPPRNPARALRRSSKENAVRASRSSLARASGGLSYKASTVSTASVYSTQSEEPQTRVPAAVIVAALGHTFGTRRLSALHHTYTIGEEQINSELAIPHRRLRHPLQSDSVGQLHRISNISDGSLGLQDGPYTIDPIGVAYGGEDCEEPFCEGDKEQLAVEQFYVPEGSLDHEIAHDGCSTDIH